MLTSSASLLGVLAAFGMCTRPAVGEAAPMSTGLPCASVTSVDGIQMVIDAGIEEQNVCITLEGAGGAAGWTMQDVQPLAIAAGQTVVVDCDGKDFTLGGTRSRGNLTMGPGSSLSYADCRLQDFMFPESYQVRNTVHRVTDSTFAMPSCTFVSSLSTTYAPLIADLQPNASFDLGPTVARGSGAGSSAAVHIFTATFDSLLGPQFRYEIFNSTGHCGPDATVAAEAAQLAATQGSEVVVASVGAAGVEAAGMAAAGPDVASPFAAGPLAEGPDMVGRGALGPGAVGPVAEGPDREYLVAFGPEVLGPGAADPGAEGQAGEEPAAALADPDGMRPDAAGPFRAGADMPGANAAGQGLSPPDTVEPETSASTVALGTLPAWVSAALVGAVVCCAAWP